MYLLIGVKRSYYPEDEYYTASIAVFTSKELGVAYEKNSRLLGTYQNGYQYNKNSLLRDCCRAYIEDLPVDPVLETRRG
jgi:hypothetical protein